MANWIKGAIKHPGSFGRQAKAAGESTSAFESSVLAKGGHASGRTKKRARLSRTLRMLRERKAA